MKTNNFIKWSNEKVTSEELTRRTNEAIAEELPDGLVELCKRLAKN